MRRLYLVLFFTVLTLISAVASGFPVFYSLLYVLIGAMLISLAWAAANLAWIRVTVERRWESPKVGRFIDAELLITNKSLLPKAILEIRDMEALPAQVTGKVLNLLPFQTVRWHVQAPLKKRGVYSLGPPRVFSSDPFGLFRLSRAFQGTEEVTVYPLTVDLHNFWLSPNDLFHQGSHYQHIHESAPSVSNIRDYNPGDGLQRIHWPSTARTQKLMVKQFENEIGNHLWIVLDMHHGVKAGGDIDNTEEYGITIAASIAERFLATGWPVGLIAHGEARCFLAPQLGGAALDDILRALAMARATGSEALAETLRQSWSHFGASSRVVIITSSADSAWIEHVSTSSIQRPQLTVVLIDAQSFGGSQDASTAVGLLQGNSILTYLVRRGDDLATALDYRPLAPYHDGATSRKST